MPNAAQRSARNTPAGQNTGTPSAPPADNDQLAGVLVSFSRKPTSRGRKPIELSALEQQGLLASLQSEDTAIVHTSKSSSDDTAFKNRAKRWAESSAVRDLAGIGEDEVMVIVFGEPMTNAETGAVTRHAWAEVHDAPETQE